MRFLSIVFACILLGLMASCVSQSQNSVSAPNSSQVHITGVSKYDYQFVNMVSSNWYQLLKDGKYNSEVGRVIVKFRLHSDGSVSDVRVKSSDVNGQLTDLCKKAVSIGAPYPTWPDDVFTTVKASWCEVQFKFDYLQ
jgi:TonB family protein